jgi:electron-transferring-flavoprotein dehydrogenase
MSQDVETIEYDVIIVGAGPAGLTTAIRLKQLAKKHKKDIKICILEKGAQVGAHILSGAVLDPKVLKELLPDEYEKAPLLTPVQKDKFYLLTQKHAIRLPTPPQMKNHGNYIISLGELCQFLASKAEALGVEIYPGFAASKVIYNKAGHVLGVATNDMGINKEGKKTSKYQPGMHIHAKQTIFAEGCRGHLSNQIIQRFQLRLNKSPQTYGLGIKEVWKVPEKNHEEGLVIHTVGWPLPNDTYGGAFIYHLSQSRVALGFVTGLDYQNPYLSPFEEMQRFKTHPLVKKMLKGGERIAYGAKSLIEGGYQSLPKITFPGGLLIGDAAGFLNVPQIKGIHCAMQSGMIAAEACFSYLKDHTTKGQEIRSYQHLAEENWLIQDLYKVRNIRPGFRYGLLIGLSNAAFETYITQGRSPWTFKNHADNLQLKKAKLCTPIQYPKPDNVLTFDRLTSVYLTNTYHEEDQPVHLYLKDPTIAININYNLYDSPETRYCPAAVYEIIQSNYGPQFQINAQNCIHCKACDIKDPKQNIIWGSPEGGGGPNYIGM